MRQPEEFGAIRRDGRADLILLDSNPLENIGALNSNDGVMARGIWMDRSRLDQALDQLASIYTEPDNVAPIRPQARMPK